MSSSGFTIHHLPYGLITTPDDREPVCATAYEDYAINLKALARDGLFDKHSGGYMFVNALSVSCVPTIPRPYQSQPPPPLCTALKPTH